MLSHKYADSGEEDHQYYCEVAGSLLEAVFYLGSWLER